MKKSKILLIGFAVVLCGAIGMVSSCTDYESDYVRDLQNRVDFLTDSVSGLDAAIVEEVNKLKQANAALQADINSKTDTARFAADSLRTEQLEALVNKIDGVLGMDVSDSSTVAEKISFLDSVQYCWASISAFDTLYKEKHGSDLEGLLAWHDSVTASVSKANQALLLAQQNETDLASLTSEFRTRAKQLSDSLSSVYDSLADLRELVNDTVKWVLDSAMNYAQKQRAELETIIVNGDNKVLDSLSNIIKDSIASLRQEMIDSAASVLAGAKAYTDQREQYLTGLLDGKADTASLNTIKKYSIQADSILKSRIDSLAGKTAALESDMSALKTRTDSIVSVLDSMGLKLDSIDNRLDSIEDVIDSITSVLSAVETSLSKFVTEIIVQDVENVLWNSFNTPFGIRSHVIIGTYGKNGNIATKFPATNPNNYVYADQFVDFSGINPSPLTIGAGEILVNVPAKIYLTVNPNTVDFDGVKVAMVNSQDVAAPGFDSLTLQKSDKVLKFFDMTRSVNNGFYEAVVNINPEKAAQSQPHVNTTALKNAAAALKNNWKSKKNILNLAETILSEFKNTSLEAYGIKSSWKDGFNVEHSVYSYYDIAALTYQPLSYEFAKGKVVKIGRKLPVLPDLKSWMAAHGLKLEPFAYDPVGGFPVSFAIRIPNFQNAKIQVQDNGTIIDASVHVPDNDPSRLSEAVITVDNIDLKVKANVSIIDSTTVQVVIPDSAMSPLIYQINNRVSGVFDEMNTMLTGAGDIVELAQDKLIDRINSYITRINNLIPDSIDVNMMVQPTIFFNNAAGSFSELSSVKSIPTSMSVGNTATMILSSYTAELLAPAYKKYIAVTNVWDLDGVTELPAAKNSANSAESFNSVLDGVSTFVPFTPSQKGIYEIAYSAIDYSGKIVTGKYYVKVK